MTDIIIPNYEQVDRRDLYSQDGSVRFYRVSPAKGARVEGVIAVGMAMEYGRDNWGRPERGAPFPQMSVELSPRLLDEDGKVTSRRLPLRINGRDYTAAFFATVTFLPAQPNDDRMQWHPLVTLDGRDYLLSDRVQYHPGITEAARKLLRPLLLKLAAEYVTVQRWHDQHIREAMREIDKAAAVVTQKEADLAAAKEKVSEAWRTLNAMMQRFSAPEEGAQCATTE